jgi:cellulose synthase/poly-beta-1,6-N-acetylglucosamine synthase-like glycosyltransferase
VTLLIVAAVSFGILALTWVVYPAAMWLRRGADHRNPATAGGESVAVIVATRDDSGAAVTRVQNLRRSAYPPRLLDVIVCVDRAAPEPLERYNVALHGLARVVPGDAPGGKAANLNAGVRAANGAQVLVFADVGQEFDEGTIPLLVAELRAEQVGGVAGRYTQHRDDGVMAAYAKLEAVIREGQARGHSVVSTSGSIYAIRASLWRELPPGLICDDLFTTLSVVSQGYRVTFNPDAIAYDPRSFTRDQQFVRRVRTLTGLIQYCTLRPSALWPWSNPIWPHFMLHKVLRLLTPIPLATGSIALAAWLALYAPAVLVAALILITGVTVAGMLVAPRTTRAGWNALAWMLRLQLIPAIAISNGLRRRWTVWAPTPQAGSRAEIQA